ncbi:Y-family DNA polymerase [Enterococcus sp.]|uniref:Y-family DNA polymerase n=1 Tax=Enterococcus sp. TaxID=35783 RepID=UPI002FCC0B0B
MTVYFDYSQEPRSDYLCIDCRSFYASCEAVMRGLDPLKALLVVLSGGDRPGGLILSASPQAKERLGVSNVTRRSEVPNHPDLILAPPRMKEYIEINLKILETIATYVPPEDFHVYSIDEVFVKYDNVKHLYQNKDVTLFALALMRKIAENTGIRTAIGIGDNMLLAKLALDNEAKKNPLAIAEWRYESVPSKVWTIQKMTDFWGIAHGTKKRLNDKGIRTIQELANYDPYRLKHSMGVIGAQLHAHANGIDRSQIGDVYKPAEKSLSNSQILLKDYNDVREIKVIIREMSDLLASRLRKKQAKTACIHLFIGYSKIEQSTGFSHQLKIPETNNTKTISLGLLQLFDQSYQPGTYVRQIGVGGSRLHSHTNIQLDLFENPEEQIKQEQLHYLKDKIREKYGFQSLIYASSLLENATAISRSTKIGGH